MDEVGCDHGSIDGDHGGIVWLSCGVGAGAAGWNARP